MAGLEVGIGWSSYNIKGRRILFVLFCQVGKDHMVGPIARSKVGMIRAEAGIGRSDQNQLTGEWPTCHAEVNVLVMRAYSNKLCTSH